MDGIEAEFEVGETVVYTGGSFKQGVVCTITGMDVEAGAVVYDNSLGHWGYGYQYRRCATQEAALGSEGRAAA